MSIPTSSCRRLNIDEHEPVYGFLKRVRKQYDSLTPILRRALNGVCEWKICECYIGFRKNLCRFRNRRRLV